MRTTSTDSMREARRKRWQGQESDVGERIGSRHAGVCIGAGAGAAFECQVGKSRDQSYRKKCHCVQMQRCRIVQQTTGHVAAFLLAGYRLGLHRLVARGTAEVSRWYTCQDISQQPWASVDRAAHGWCESDGQCGEQAALGCRRTPICHAWVPRAESQWPCKDTRLSCMGAESREPCKDTRLPCMVLA